MRARWGIIILAAALTSAGIPTGAAPGTSNLTGAIRSAPDQEPLGGARLFAASSAGGEIHPSQPTGDDGRFELPDLPPGTYDLAVGIDERLYLVKQPVVVSNGEPQRLNILVHADAQPVPGEAAEPRPGVWSNPLTASLIVVGAAIIVGVLVNNATNDEDGASNF